MKGKERLDTMLVERNLFTSREKAQAAIMAGLVMVNGVRADKAGQKFAKDVQIEKIGEAIPYVSRGGLKLERALAHFNIDPEEKTCMDVGASTGGFTDCLLQHGAKKVYAVDVGYGQLDWKLRNDSRVVVMERTNIRYLQPDSVEDPIELAVVDVSFISLKKVLPVVAKLLLPEGELVCLIKPQFEVGRELVGKKGVVKDPKIHADTLISLADFFSNQSIAFLGLTYSPITGPEGNIEFLVYLRSSEDMGMSPQEATDLINHAVNEGHLKLR